MRATPHACIEPTPDFVRKLDKSPFAFAHSLSRHPLLSRAALKRLVEQVAALPEKPNQSRGFFRIKGGQPLSWGSDAFQQALNRAFDNLETSQARIKLSRINEVEGYGAVLEQFTQELTDATGGLIGQNHYGGIATLFLSSPQETTPYHMDEETNFLLQIHGAKRVNVYDRSLVTAEEFERFWQGEVGTAAVEKPNSQATAFDLAPGTGVHVPPFFPHMVQNGHEVSVSLSLAFSGARCQELEVHRMNAYLKKAGIKPAAFGTHPARDRVKVAMVRGIRTVKKAIG